MYYNTRTGEDKARYGVCCRRGNPEVMKDGHVLVTIANNMGCEVVTQNFGGKACIVVIQDEAAMVSEPDTWIALTKLRHHAKVRGLWLIVDFSQLSPLILSLYANVNPFAAQMQLSLFARRYPAVSVSVCQRQPLCRSEAAQPLRTSVPRISLALSSCSVAGRIASSSTSR